MGADKLPEPKPRPQPGVGDPMPPGKNESDMGGDSTQTVITHHGDGTHSVEHHDGEQSGPHEHLHEAFAHISAKHHPESDHSHIMHHEGGSHTSHHVNGGEVNGPHEHPDMGALQEHMGRFLAEEAKEPEHGGKGGSMHEPAMMGM